MADKFFGASIEGFGGVEADAHQEKVGTRLFDLPQQANDLLERMFSEAQEAQGRTPADIAIRQADLYKAMTQQWVSAASGIFADVRNVDLAVLGSLPVLVIDLVHPQRPSSTFTVTIPFNSNLRELGRRIIDLYEKGSLHLTPKKSSQASEGGSAYRNDPATTVVDNDAAGGTAS